jgi:hypothetical protein
MAIRSELVWAAWDRRNQRDPVEPGADDRVVFAAEAAVPKAPRSAE